MTKFYTHDPTIAMAVAQQAAFRAAQTAQVKALVNHTM